MLPHPPGHMSVIEEFGGGERVKSLFLLSENRLLTRGLPMDHGSGVYGSVRGKPEEEEEEEEKTRLKNCKCCSLSLLLVRSQT